MSAYSSSAKVYHLGTAGRIGKGSAELLLISRFDLSEYSTLGMRAAQYSTSDGNELIALDARVPDSLSSEEFQIQLMELETFIGKSNV